MIAYKHKEFEGFIVTEEEIKENVEKYGEDIMQSYTEGVGASSHSSIEYTMKDIPNSNDFEEIIVNKKGECRG